MNQEAGQTKILIVEPDEYYHQQFRDHVADAAQLIFSKGLTNAFRMIEQQQFNLIVTELLFPDGHAYDLLSRIQDVPVIIYTKIGHMEDIEQSLNLGVSGYFVKGQDSINDVKQLILSLA